MYFHSSLLFNKTVHQTKESTNLTPTEVQFE